MLFMRTFLIDAQVLHDTASLNLVKTTVNQIYNMRFSDATETTNLLSKNYPEHPVVFLLRGMIIYWEGFPLLSGSEKGREFEQQMHLCINSSEDFGPENEAEFLLANLSNQPFRGGETPGIVLLATNKMLQYPGRYNRCAEG